MNELPDSLRDLLQELFDNALTTTDDNPSPDDSPAGDDPFAVVLPNPVIDADALARLIDAIMAALDDDGTDRDEVLAGLDLDALLSGGLDLSEVFGGLALPDAVREALSGLIPPADDTLASPDVPALPGVTLPDLGIIIEDRLDAVFAQLDLAGRFEALEARLADYGLDGRFVGITPAEIEATVRSGFTLGLQGTGNNVVLDVRDWLAGMGGTGENGDDWIRLDDDDIDALVLLGEQAPGPVRLDFFNDDSRLPDGIRVFGSEIDMALRATAGDDLIVAGGGRNTVAGRDGADQFGINRFGDLVIEDFDFLEGDRLVFDVPGIERLEDLAPFLTRLATEDVDGVVQTVLEFAGDLLRITLQGVGAEDLRADMIAFGSFG